MHAYKLSKLLELNKCLMNMNSRHCFCLLNLQTSRTYTHVQTRPRQPTYLQQPHQPQPPQPQHSRSFTRDPKRTPSHSKSSAPTFMRGKNNATDQRKNSEPIFKPIVLKVGYDNEQDDIGAELCGSSLDKQSVNEILMAFKQNPTVESLALEAGVNARMFAETLASFRNSCINSRVLPVDLSIKLQDINAKAANTTDLFPYFLNHVFAIYPHLKNMDDLKHLSDLRDPAFWYMGAREMKRKIIYHSGPTNSGKTYTATKAFQESASGIYCGPLKLLAREVYNKCNQTETKCDLITGEERMFARDDSEPSNHVSCTIEMANLNKSFDVAVIDEIQMIKDPQRGWAWTRALLGLRAKEIHVCGDGSALDLVAGLSFSTGDDFTTHTYTRLTPLHVMDKALESFDNVEPGDCFVCFSKNDIFQISKKLEERGHDVAIIYGSMPPGVKMGQAARFNDPTDKCKIMVATDAIGMGLNLNIRRIIFYSIRKISDKRDMDRKSGDLDYITTSQALQIAGRAGRYKTQFQDGYVTTFYNPDLPTLQHILKKPLENTTQAGLHPTPEQVELFSYLLPNHSLSELLRIFKSICTLDNSQYFLCNYDEVIGLADLIDHIPLQVRKKYTFVQSPISTKDVFLSSCLVKFVRAYSNNEVVDESMLQQLLEWPLKQPENGGDLLLLESKYDALDLYLWLSIRFSSNFCYREQAIAMRQELETIIYEGLTKMSATNKNAQLGKKSVMFVKKINALVASRSTPAPAPALAAEPAPEPELAQISTSATASTNTSINSSQENATTKKKKSTQKATSKASSQQSDKAATKKSTKASKEPAGNKTSRKKKGVDSTPKNMK